ncbi:RNA polymerase sigma factor [Stieleria varia]|uniref:ECF RNA polymerase sigma factor SigW n=1 Tax=Stieleria varia TaxID=2528005 RepID=A0A5C6B7T2_9BACT|nr:sigma-70 family RNA polymerase sigma factor [Stieleria varia]TWU07662.1 ECF RNA polymerase sigma factor SigW [Stieleria varia]
MMTQPQTTDDQPVTPESLNQRSDGELLDAWFRDSHHDAFAQLVRRYSVMVLSVCQRRCRTPADVDDAYQSTFLHLAHRGRSIRHPERLPGWLHRVAQRSAMATLRMHNTENSAMIEPAAKTTDPLEQITRQHEAIVMDEELASLPESYRAVLVMHMSDDCSLQRMAEQFQTTLGSIRGRLHRGKKMLAARLRRRGLVPVVAFAAASATMVSHAQAASAGDALIRLTAGPDLPPPPTPIPPPEPFFSSGATLMTTLATTAGVLAFGSLAFWMTMPDQTGHAEQTKQTVAAIALPADESPVTAQFGGGGMGGMGGGGMSVTNGQIVGKEVRVLPAKPTTAVASQVEEMMDESKDLSLTGTVGDLATELQTQLGIPVIMDQRGIAFAEADLGAAVKYSGKEEPLRAALRKLLSPLGLKAVIENEGLVITADPNVLVHQGIGTSRWIALEEQSMTEIADALNKKVSVEFIDTPLVEALDVMSEELGMQILIDKRALEEIGLTTDEPVTLDASDKKALDLINLMLQELDLTLTATNNQLTVTTVDAADGSLMTRVYWLEGIGMANNYDSLIQLIETSIEPDSWESLGGTSTIAPYPTNRPTIVISTNFPNHLRIESLIETLRQAHFGMEPEVEEVKLPPAKEQGPPGGGGFF